MESSRNPARRLRRATQKCKVPMFHSIHSGKLRGAAPILLAFLLIKELERDVDTHNTVNSVNTHTLTADQPFVP